MKEEELEKDEEKEKKGKQNEAGVLYAPEVYVDFIGVSGDLKTKPMCPGITKGVSPHLSSPLLLSLTPY